MGINPTRRQTAEELFQSACRGPALEDLEMRKLYRLWSTTWLLPKIKRLIPELSNAELPPITSEPDPFWKKYFGEEA